MTRIIKCVSFKNRIAIISTDSRYIRTFPEFDSTPLDGVGMGVGEFLRRKIHPSRAQSEEERGWIFGEVKRRRRRKKGEKKSGPGFARYQARPPPPPSLRSVYTRSVGSSRT